MRIVSGIHKGRRITAPKNLPVRPTTDMAKESLFNILRNTHSFDQVSVLDLFAGTGNISYEFASRGARLITAVDAHAGCARFIGTTATRLDMGITAIKSDVFKYLKKVSGTFDIIFADPPYGMDQKDFKMIATTIFDQGLLADGGTLIIEHGKHTSLEKTEHFKEMRNYGSSAFSFFG